MVYWLSIFGMVCWGVAPVFAKLGLDQISPMSGLLIRMILASSMILSWYGLKGSIKITRSIPLRAWWLITGEAFLTIILGDLAYFAAIKRGDISIVTLIMASSPIVTMICASIFLNEKITMRRMIGTVLVIIGIAFVV